MFSQKDLLVLISLVLVLIAPILSNPQDDSVRFSRLLNGKPELLRQTSISNDPPPKFNAKEYRKGFVSVKKAQSESVDVPIFPREYLHGEPYVQVEQSVREESLDQNKEGTLTNINQKPISGRIPVTVLRQSSAGTNRLNISPVFTEQDGTGNRRRPLVENVTEKREEPKVDEDNEQEHDITTLNPTYDEADDIVTTENGPEIDEDASPSPVPSARNIPEIFTATTVFDNRTSVTPSSVISSTTQNIDEFYKENSLAETFHRKGHFPDFEDSPSHLVTAESSQPARVNVRPASSGKDYEYEYIYYYYDDDDDDNNTAVKSSSDAPAVLGAIPTPASILEPESSKIVDNFSPDKIQTSKNSAQLNSLERSRESKILPEYESQTFVESHDVPVQDQDSHNTHEPVTELPEPVKIQKPIGNRPIVLKQSSFALTTSIPVTTTTTTTTTELPSTTSQVPVSRQAGPRFRGSKDRFEAPKQNKYVPSVQTVTEAALAAPIATEEPTRRSIYKDTSRRTPTRRPTSPQPQVEEPTTEKAKPAAPKLKLPEDHPARPALRTRFPPRISPTTVSNEVVENNVADAAPSNSILEVAPPQLSTLQPNSIEADDRKSKDNFARTKSINDLYALTRLHQLAINTRIPNRKNDSGPIYKGTPPKLAGGFVSSSSEGTTQLPDEHLVSEATTVTAFIPASHVASSTTEQVTTLSTTEDHFGGKRGRFRGRTRPTQSAPTSTEAPGRPASPNRFGGRRKNFTPADAQVSVAPEGVAVAPVEEVVSSSAPPALRAPGRHRFSGRARQPSLAITTENAESIHTNDEPPAAPVEQVTQAAPPRKQRPQGSFGQNRRRPTTTQLSPAETSETPAAPLPYAPEPEKRRPSAGVAAGNAPRTRPNAGAGGPIVGRPLRLRKTTTTTTEASESVVPPQEIEPAVEQSPTILTEQLESASPAGSGTPKVSISSTATIVESPVEPTTIPKRGSAAALGRLRPRTKPAALPTTSVPEVATTARKPSRLSGILNRKKLGQPVAPFAAPVKSEEEHEDTHDHGQEQEEAVPKGVIVQVSTIVSESEESPDHVGEVVDDHSSSTPASILNRLKSQRKPGSLFRKRVE